MAEQLHVIEMFKKYDFEDKNVDLETPE